MTNSRRRSLMFFILVITLMSARSKKKSTKYPCMSPDEDSCRESSEETKATKKQVTKPFYSFGNHTFDVWCKFQPNGFPCKGGKARKRYYYDVKLKDCTSSDSGDECPHNYNNFPSQKDCYSSCREEGEHSIVTLELDAHVYCRLQPEFGDCNEYHPSFYYDVTKRQCLGFAFSGCGGNANRFSNAQLCASVCSTVVEYE